MLQIARNACDVDDGVLSRGRKLLIDRDAKYSGDWRKFIEEQGVEVIRLPPKSPNLNAYAERFVRSIKDECLNRMIFIGEASLRRAVREFMAQYSSVRLTFEQIQLVGRIRANRAGWIELKQLIQRSCLEHGQTQDL
jgi:putative transposase